MKKFILIICPLFLIVLLVFGIRIGLQENNYSQLRSIERPKLDLENIPDISIPTSQGDFDNPHARLNYEFLRLQSPKTHRIPQNIRVKELVFTKKLPKSDRISSSSNSRTKEIAFNFESRGPINIGGRTRAVALDMSDASFNTILAGGVSGGMWRTTDLGETWTQTTTPDQFPSVVSIVQDTRPGNENIWYYGTGEIIGNSASDRSGLAIFRGDGIYKSTDSGQSWSVIPSTSDGDITNIDNPVRFVNRLVIDTTNQVEDELYAAVIDGIIRTSDGFETFEFVLGDTSNTSLSTEVAITSTGVLYATISDDFGDNTEIGIWTSADGLNWTEIPVPDSISTPGFERTTIGISPSNESLVYFFRTESSGEDFNLFLYNAEEDTLIVRPENALPENLSTQSSYDQFVIVHPTDPDIVYLGGVELYRSINGFRDSSTTQVIGGLSFSDTPGIQVYANHHPDQHDFLFFPDNPNRSISSHDGGLSITNNNLKSDTTSDNFFDALAQETVSDLVVVDYDNLNNGYNTAQYFTIAINNKDVNFPWIIGGLQDNSSIISQVDSPTELWGTLFGGDGAFAELTNNSLIASAQFAQAVRFSIINDGSETGIIFPPNAGESDSYLFVNPILSDPVIPNKVFIAGRGEIFMTFDVTTNPVDEDWISISSNVLEATEAVTAMDASTQPANELYFGTFNLNTASSRILRVDNTNLDDPNTVALSSTGLPSNGFISSIEVNPRNSDDIFIVYSNFDIVSIFNSQDGGNSWVAIAGNLEENPDGSGAGVSTRWMEILPNGSDNIYMVGTSAGLFFTEQLNAMNTEWFLAGENTIGNQVVDMLSVRPIDGYIAVATHGNGVYQTRVDVPIQANIVLDQFPCEGDTILILPNFDDPNEQTGLGLSYELLIDNQVAGTFDPNSTGLPFVIPDDTPTSYQVRIENSSGEISLSNEVVIQAIDNEFCNSRPVILNMIDELDELNLSLFPNPSSKFINVSGFDPSENHTFSITDLNGNQILENRLVEERINISSLNPGVYIFSLDNGSEKAVKRFIVE
ncbi:MAG: T9SS type A sorting domain-containing protein [Bacteroidota bacterium]